jgi:Uncharacterised nucleotidyltransferase/BON domain
MADPGRHRGHHARMERVLVRAVEEFDRAGVDHALMGGLASAAIGRDRHTHDVDVFIAPQDRERALDLLAGAGFRTERTDPEWLYKAFWDDVMVDLIFVSKGGIVLDDEVRRHRRHVEVQGRQVLALSPEDLLVIKALANAEHVPRHWYDALAILADVPLDWPYLVRRARPYSGRVSSLLLYAAADGIPVPAEPLRELCEAAMTCVPTPSSTEAEHHLAAHVRRALAADPRVADPDVSVTVDAGEVVVRGCVATAERRRAIETVLRELVGTGHLRNEVEVLER